jgi:hypothetical protein
MARELDQVGSELRKQQEALATLATIHRVSLNAELAAQRKMQLEAEHQNFGVQLEGLKARREVIERQIAEIGKKLTEGSGADPAVMKELTNAVEANKKVLLHKEQLFVVKTVGPEEVEVAKVQVALAQAELAKYRRAAADAAGGGRIEELKRRLDDTAIEMAEMMARREAVQKQIEQASSSSADVEIKRLEVEQLKQDYRDAAAELSKLRSKLKLYIPPQVMLVPLE